MRYARTLSFLVAYAAFPALLNAQTYPSSVDPRTGLKPGRFDAGAAASNMRLVSFSPKAAVFDTARGLSFINSDLAFRGHHVYQGNFSGFTIWDVSNPVAPKVVSAVSCVTSQGDPTIIGNLLFVSAEGAGNRSDCAKGGVQDLHDHMAGVRIYDVSNPAAPRLVKNVQTCKGSHTHTAIPHPTLRNIVYIYVSGGGDARPDSIVPGCKAGTDPADPTNSLYRLDVIKVDLTRPENAEVVTGARIFTGLTPVERATSRIARTSGRGGRGGRGAAAATDSDGPRTQAADPVLPSSRNCHDVTAYPAFGLLAGACGTYGMLVDVSNPERPRRLDAKSDTNFSLWHTAVFSNDGSKVVFTDEWGGGTSPMCQATSMMEMGGNTVLSIDPRTKKLTQHAYFKIPTAQTAQENCVSHNGGLVPVPGRDIMVQGWYQGGVSVMDFTDPNRLTELAYYDRGPIESPLAGDDAAVGRGRGTIGGSWGAYWWNGYVYSSELDRGFDIYELLPSDQLSLNEIEAAKLVRMVEYNPQSQPRLSWPASFFVVRSYFDQLVRANALSAARVTAIDNALTEAEARTGAARATALNALAVQVDRDVTGSKDPARVRTMAAEIRRLAAAR